MNTIRLGATAALLAVTGCPGDPGNTGRTSESGDTGDSAELPVACSGSRRGALDVACADAILEVPRDQDLGGVVRFPDSLIVLTTDFWASSDSAEDEVHTWAQWIPTGTPIAGTVKVGNVGCQFSGQYGLPVPTVDVDGDGRPDALAESYPSSAERRYVDVIGSSKCKAVQTVLVADSACPSSSRCEFDLFGVPQQAPSGVLMEVWDYPKQVEWHWLPDIRDLSSAELTDTTLAATLVIPDGVVGAHTWLADLSGDGRDDIIVETTTSDEFAIYAVTSWDDGPVIVDASMKVLSLPREYAGFSFGDVTGDGIVDMLAQHVTDLGVWELQVYEGPLSASGGTSSPVGLVSSAPGYQRPAFVSDLSGDGVGDILVSQAEGEASDQHVLWFAGPIVGDVGLGDAVADISGVVVRADVWAQLGEPVVSDVDGDGAGDLVLAFQGAERLDGVALDENIEGQYARNKGTGLVYIFRGPW